MVKKRIQRWKKYRQWVDDIGMDEITRYWCWIRYCMLYFPDCKDLATFKSEFVRLLTIKNKKQVRLYKRQWTERALFDIGEFNTLTLVVFLSDFDIFSKEYNLNIDKAVEDTICQDFLNSLDTLIACIASEISVDDYMKQTFGD